MIAIQSKADAQQWLSFRQNLYNKQQARLLRRRQTIGVELETIGNRLSELLAQSPDHPQSALGNRKAILGLVEGEHHRLIQSPLVATFTMGEDNQLVIITHALPDLGNAALRLTVNLQTLSVNVAWEKRPAFWSRYPPTRYNIHTLGSDPIISHVIRVLLMGARLDLLPDLIVGAVRNNRHKDEAPDSAALQSGLQHLRHRQIMREQNRPLRLPLRGLHGESGSMMGIIKDQDRLCAELVRVEAALAKLAEDKPFFEKVASEFELLKKLPLVEGISISEDAYIIFTGQVQLKDETGINRDIGRFQITVNAAKSVVYFRNLDRVTNGYQHPHIGGPNGCQPCLGSLRSWLAKRFIVGEIGIEMVPQLLQFLTSWNKNDAYKPASAWPKARA